MTVSSFQTYVNAIKADMADSTVAFLVGKKGLTKNAQLRRIVFICDGGSIEKCTGRGAVGPSNRSTKIVYQFNANISVHVFAQNSTPSTPEYADEDKSGEIELLASQFLTSAFRVKGDNQVFGGYEWLGEDSDGGGSHSVRQACQVINVVVQFPQIIVPKSYVTIASTTHTGVLQPTGVFQHGYGPTGPIGP